MKYWLNPSKNQFDFQQLKEELNQKFPEEKYRQKTTLENIPDFEIENPFYFLVNDIDNPSKTIRLNVYLQKNRLNPKKPKGIIIMNHGFNGHIQKLKQIAYYFSNLGYDSIGFDTRGFGKSEGFKGFVHEHFQYHIEDNIAFYQLVDNFYKDNRSIPRIALGQSFGGLIAIQTNIQINNYFSCMILLAPAIRQQAEVQKQIKKLLPFISFFSFRFNLFINPKANGSSKNPNVTTEIQNDPYFFKQTKPKSILNVFKNMEKYGFYNLDLLTTPYILVQGTVDKLVDLEASFDFFQKTLNVKNKTLLVVDNLWHAIHSEQEIYEIQDILNNWLKNILTKSSHKK